MPTTTPTRRIRLPTSQPNHSHPPCGDPPNGYPRHLPPPAAPSPSATPSPRDPQSGVRLGGGEVRQEIVVAREIRAAGLVGGLTAAEIAGEIHDRCGSFAGTSRIRAYRLALGVSLADVVAQIRAWYANEGRPAPRFSETLLSAYESGQKRPGPEYLHYLCAVYRAEPADLGYHGQCFCGRAHRAAPRSRTAAQVPTPAAVSDGSAPGPAESGDPRDSPVCAGPMPADGHGVEVDELRCWVWLGGGAFMCSLVHVFASVSNILWSNIIILLSFHPF